MAGEDGSCQVRGCRGEEGTSGHVRLVFGRFQALQEL